MKKCPFCAEEIQEEAIKCRYCGSNLQKDTPKPQPVTPLQSPISPKVTEKVTSPKSTPKSTKPIKTVIGVLLLVLVIIGTIVVVLQYYQREALRQQEAEKQRIEEAKRISAFTQILPSDLKIKSDFWKGGITLQNITLTNPTSYSFSSVSYEFYDANDNVTKFSSYVGPLFPYQTQTFKIDNHVEGLWEHQYGIRITGGTVVQ